MEIFCVVFILLAITAIIGKVLDQEKKNEEIEINKNEKQEIYNNSKIIKFEELDEFVNNVCSTLTPVKISKTQQKWDFGLTNIDFGTNPPKTYDDLAKLGCTNIEVDDNVILFWQCEKKIGNKNVILNNHFELDDKNFPLVSVSGIWEEINNNNSSNNSASKPSSVYLMFNPLNNTYKIGKANDVYKRLRTFQTGTPDIQLVTYKTYASEKQAFQMENMLHRQYEDSNYKKEWFNLNEEDVEFIKQTLS